MFFIMFFNILLINISFLLCIRTCFIVFNVFFLVQDGVRERKKKSELQCLPSISLVFGRRIVGRGNDQLTIQK